MYCGRLWTLRKYSGFGTNDQCIDRHRCRLQPVREGEYGKRCPIKQGHDLLERGQVVFSSGTIMSDNLDDITSVADSDYDFAIIEMEHQGFDFTNLRTECWPGPQ